MLPLKDHNKTRSFPFINYALIALNIWVFFIQLGAVSFEEFALEWGFIPVRFTTTGDFTHVFTSMFMHGGWMHLISNMWFLHIFGDNVEDTFGHLKYLLFYLFFGTAAVFAQYILSPESTLPLIGASGAISGVAGAYYVFFRHSKIATLVPLLGFFSIINLPSTLFLGYWFLVQLFNGAGSLVTTTGEEGGVAWFAHIGGFIAGYIVAKFFFRTAHPTHIEP